MHKSEAPYQQRDDEGGDGCSATIETKGSSHQRGSGPSKQNAYQVSYLAVSSGDSKEVHHVTGSGWRRVSAIMDSGYVGCVAPEDIPLMETEVSRQGQTYCTADGGVIKNKRNRL